MLISERYQSLSFQCEHASILQHRHLIQIYDQILQDDLRYIDFILLPGLPEANRLNVHLALLDNRLFSVLLWVEANLVLEEKQKLIREVGLDFVI